MPTQTVINDVGPTGMLPRGPYSPTATYTANHVVLYKHDSWVCKALDANGEALEISGIAPDDATYGAQNWQALTDGGAAAYAEGETARQKGLAAESQGNAAEQKGNTAATKAELADQKAALANTKAELADQKAALANTAAENADQKAALANTAAGTADTAAANADDKAALADQKATLANTKAELADQKATLASQKAQYATEQGDYAKAQADLAKAWNDNPPYIGDGTTGDLNYWYLYDITTEQYVKGPYAKGDDLDWNEMSQADKDALAQMVLDRILFDDEPTEDSDRAVKSGGIYNALEQKQDTLTFATVAESEAAAEELT